MDNMPISFEAKLKSVDFKIKEIIKHLGFIELMVEEDRDRNSIKKELCYLKKELESCFIHTRDSKEIAYQKERERLLEEVKDFVTIPPIDFSKKTNEEIKKYISMTTKMFDEAFFEEEKDEL